ncbi:HDOD domain-containing protein [Solidesulfovibrio alcoholivorans]|uniref:HDOD domain-containing protein n=1 Tax=Solidesulfovibrio alcoholivorans TaxID=81406 RepID=UPI000495FCF3|nr:HDOD domain-containing protein [Solidesulfovibrio alcoholivorans]
MSQERGQRFLLDLPAVKNDLPYSPDLLTRLFRLTGEEGLSPLEAIAAAVAEDQGLSARLLALANSAFYGLQSQVGTVGRAVAVLGLREVRSLVLALGMRGLADARPLPPGFAFAPYLAHQLAVAGAARGLARTTAAMDPDDAFTAGLLHDLGKLLTALYRPEDWQAQAALAAAESLSWHEAEERYWGLDHGLIGGMVLRSWNLPETLTEPVNWHHAPLAAPGRPLPCVLASLADALAREVTDTPQPGIAPDPSLAALLGLSLDAARQCVETALADGDTAALAAALA